MTNFVSKARPGEIRLCSGSLYSVFEPNPAVLTPKVFASALSKLCRYGGHTKKFYSVAQHTVLMLGITPDDFQKQVLLHDVTEAVLVDLPSPIKDRLAAYKEIEQMNEQIIFSYFGVEYPLSPVVKLADKIMRCWEQRDLMVGSRPDFEDLVVTIKNYPVIKPLAPEKAEKQFLDNWYSIF